MDSHWWLQLTSGYAATQNHNQYYSYYYYHFRLLFNQPVFQKSCQVRSDPSPPKVSTDEPFRIAATRFFTGQTPVLSPNQWWQSTLSLMFWYSVGRFIKVTVKFTILHQDSEGGWTTPSARPWVRRWRTTNVGDAWPVWRQTYSYLPSHKASLPTGWYQIILLGDRGARVITTCPRLHSTAGHLGFEPVTCWSQVQRRFIGRM